VVVTRQLPGWFFMTEQSAEQIEYLEAVLLFHEPNTPPSTCMWCGLPSPCPPYLQAKASLAAVGGSDD